MQAAVHQSRGIPLATQVEAHNHNARFRKSAKGYSSLGHERRAGGLLVSVSLARPEGAGACWGWGF